ncbi:MAG: hypothetical protein ACI4SS_03590 [Clostridia bacterium]
MVFQQGKVPLTRCFPFSFLERVKEMENYQSNSHKSREQQLPTTEKRVDKAVVTGCVKTKKKTGIKKLADIFFPEDIESVKSYIVTDVIIPLIKKSISDTVDVILYNGRNWQTRNSDASKVSYRDCYRSNRSGEVPKSRTRTGYEYDDVVVESRGEAEEVLERMDELISIYGIVSVADLYDLVGITGHYTDNKYGWTDIRNATVVRTREGNYWIRMPKAMPLD